MKSACVGVLSIIELKNARWNIEKKVVIEVHRIPYLKIVVCVTITGILIWGKELERSRKYGRVLQYCTVVEK